MIGITDFINLELQRAFHAVLRIADVEPYDINVYGALLNRLREVWAAWNILFEHSTNRDGQIDAPPLVQAVPLRAFSSSPKRSSIAALLVYSVNMS